MSYVVLIERGLVSVATTIDDGDLAIFLSLFLSLSPGHHLLDWVLREGAVELPENVMNDGWLHHLQQQPLKKLKKREVQFKAIFIFCTSPTLLCVV